MTCREGISLSTFLVSKIFGNVGRAPDISPIIDCPVSADTIRKNAEAVVRNAELARSSLHKFADLWCKAATSSKVSFNADNHEMGPTKSLERIIAKAIARYNGDVFQVSDPARNRVPIDSPAQLKALKSALSSKEFLESLAGKGIKIVEVEDKFENPTATHWRGLVVKTEINLGKGRTQLAETVVMPRGWVQDYETTHIYLEQIRTLKDLAKAQGRKLTPHEQSIVEKHTLEAQKIHDGLAHADGYENLEIARPNQQKTQPASGIKLH